MQAKCASPYSQKIQSYTILNHFNHVHILTAYFSKSAVYLIKIPLYSYTTVHTPGIAFEVYTRTSLQQWFSMFVRLPPSKLFFLSRGPGIIGARSRYWATVQQLRNTGLQHDTYILWLCPNVGVCSKTWSLFNSYFFWYIDGCQKLINKTDIKIINVMSRHPEDKPRYNEVARKLKGSKKKHFRHTFKA